MGGTAESANAAPAVIGFYEAAAGDVSWTEALEPVANELGLHHCGLIIRRTAGANPVVTSLVDSMTESWGAAYREHYAAIEPVPAVAMRQPGGSAFTMDELGLDGSFRRSDFYNDFWKPQGCERSVFGWVLVSPQHILAFGLSRRERQGTFRADEIAYLNRVLPHVARAVRLYAAIHGPTAERTAAMSALAGLGCAMFFLGEGGTVRAHNAEADWLVNDPRIPIEIDRGRLRATRRRDQDQLNVALERCELAGTTSRVALAGADLLVDIEPVGGRVALAAVIAVSIRPLIGLAEPDRDWLAKAFGLTAAESDVAARIASGMSTSEIARARGSTVGTVRNQLKVVFDKTRTRGQAELAGLVARVPGTRKE